MDFSSNIYSLVSDQHLERMLKLLPSDYFTRPTITPEDSHYPGFSCDYPVAERFGMPSINAQSVWFNAGYLIPVRLSPFNGHYVRVSVDHSDSELFRSLPAHVIERVEQELDGRDKFTEDSGVPIVQVPSAVESSFTSFACALNLGIDKSSQGFSSVYRRFVDDVLEFTRDNLYADSLTFPKAVSVVTALLSQQRVLEAYALLSVPHLFAPVQTWNTLSEVLVKPSAGDYADLSLPTDSPFPVEFFQRTLTTALRATAGYLDLRLGGTDVKTSALAVRDMYTNILNAVLAYLQFSKHSFTVNGTSAISTASLFVEMESLLFTLSQIALGQLPNVKGNEKYKSLGDIADEREFVQPLANIPGITIPKPPKE